MPKIYKIHPAIGIARVGKSDSGYFLASEGLDGPPFELANSGEVPFAGYKDGARLMRRQGVRFRVYEYERDAASGKETLLREITSKQARIEWTVRLASRKAAGVHMDDTAIDDSGAGIVTPGTSFRNDPPSGFNRSDLVAEIELAGVTGENFKPAATPMSKLLGKPLYLGEAHTDNVGRLVVLGGMGTSGTWTNPPATLGHFLNNRGWFDDIADGPVDAKITLQGAATPHDAVGAWVVTAPPDFAPDIAPITTLYDIVVQAFFGDSQPVVSYVTDIEPLFQRIASYAWINSAGGGVFWSAMQQFLEEPDKLKDTTNVGGPLQHRRDVQDVVLEGERSLIDYRMSRRQKNLLDRWAAGDFIPGPDPNQSPQSEAQLLDRAALSRSVGGGFYPGIEAGLLLREPSIYAEFGRLTRGNFTDFGNVTARLGPGSLTERMACPWQADFVQCLGAWWPAQRPDFARFSEAGVEQQLDWDRNVRIGSPGSHASRKGMVDHFAQLGVIEKTTIGGKIVFAEKGRDPALDTGA